MDRQPLVTIAIPTHNRAASFLPETLQSALAQRYPNLQIVVSDNESTDDTEALVHRLGGERIEYRRQSGLTPNDNFNACLAAARGEYFLLLHDDDLIDPDFVESCLSAVASGWAPGVIRTGTMIIDGRGNPLRTVPHAPGRVDGVTLYRQWLDGAMEPYLCSTLYQTETLRAVGGFRSRHNLFQDVTATLLTAQAAGCMNLPAIKARFRQHGGEMTCATRLDQWCEDALFLIETVEKAGGEPASRHRASAVKALADILYGRAARMPVVRQRLAAYWTVYRGFGFRRGPWHGLFDRHVIGRLRRSYRRLSGRPLRTEG